MSEKIKLVRISRKVHKSSAHGGLVIIGRTKVHIPTSKCNPNKVIYNNENDGGVRMAYEWEGDASEVTCKRCGGQNG